MRLLHILSQLPDRTGSGVYLQSLVRQAHRRGHEQRVIAAANLGQEVKIPCLPHEQLTLVRFNSEELPFMLPGMSDVMPYPSSRFSQLTEGSLQRYCSAFEAALRRVKQVWNPQVVHTNHLWLVSAMARRVFADCPMVTSCHGTELRQLDLAPHLADRVLPAAREVERVLALTPPQEEQLVRRFGLDPDRVTVMGGSINTDVFSPPRTTRSKEFEQVTASLGMSLSSNELRMVYVGKLSRAKGVASLLDAVEQLGRRIDNFSLLMVGGGDDPEAEAIKERARTMNPLVRLMGHLPQADLADLLRGCHMLVLPSFFEGLPLVILEALVSGCRVVVTDLPSILGWPEDGLVEDGAIERVLLPPMRAVDQPEPGSLGPFADRLADAIAQQIERTRRHPLEVDGAALVRAFGWEGMFRHVEQIYGELVGKDE